MRKKNVSERESIALPLYEHYEIARKQRCKCLRRLWSIQTVMVFVVIGSVLIISGLIWGLNYGLSQWSTYSIARFARSYELATVVKQATSQRGASLVHFAYDRLLTYVVVFHPICVMLTNCQLTIN